MYSIVNKYLMLFFDDLLLLIMNLFMLSDLVLEEILFSVLRLLRLDDLLQIISANGTLEVEIMTFDHLLVVAVNG